MLQIVGGTYRETCRESKWDQLMGSGLRAAAALARPGRVSRLSTYVGEAERPLLESYAASFGIELCAETARQTLRFTYAHGLARPWIDPPLHLLAPESPIRVEAPALVRFGMLEGDAEVHGERVVYDPQSAYEPAHFHKNGSTAGSLAIVANRREASEMTGKSDIDEIGDALLHDLGATVGLIKQGAAGVRVASGSGAVDVPAYRTERVFPIGSGDVFTATFAYEWAVLKRDPVDAATEASRAAAYYCATKVLPLPSDTAAHAIVGRAIPPQVRRGGRPRVYLAGPFFTTAQRWLVEEARDALIQQGLKVFSPFHDVGIGPAEEVAPKDIKALINADGVFAIVDGLDAGTVFEVGYARARNIPVVVFVQAETEEPLKMLAGTDCEIVHDFVSAIYRISWAVNEA